MCTDNPHWHTSKQDPCMTMLRGTADFSRHSCCHCHKPKRYLNSGDVGACELSCPGAQPEAGTAGKHRKVRETHQAMRLQRSSWYSTAHGVFLAANLSGSGGPSHRKVMRIQSRRASVTHCSLTILDWSMLNGKLHCVHKVAHGCMTRRCSKFRSHSLIICTAHLHFRG